jgi:hypothetical protein
MPKTLFFLVTFSLLSLDAPAVFAHTRDVGLGVAAGLSFSPTEVQSARSVEATRVGEGFTWGFFVDIPLLETFYLSPAAMLYELDLGNGRKPVTDIDLNFKFIVPLSAARIGTGFNIGLTNSEQEYQAHVGALGYFAWNFLSNLDVFVLVTYKRLFRDPGPDIDNLHTHAGVMFRI